MFFVFPLGSRPCRHSGHRLLTVIIIIIIDIIIIIIIIIITIEY